MNNITLQEYVFKEITIIFNSHKHIFRTSSLKMRACSSQPIRFWTNLKTCINTKKTCQLQERKDSSDGNMWPCVSEFRSPRQRSTLQPAWRGCPGRRAAACSAAPSTETECGRTGCSALTGTVRGTCLLRTGLWRDTQTTCFQSAAGD